MLGQTSLFPSTTPSLFPSATPQTPSLFPQTTQQTPSLFPQTTQQTPSLFPSTTQQTPSLFPQTQQPGGGLSLFPSSTPQQQQPLSLFPSTTPSLFPQTQQQQPLGLLGTQQTPSLFPQTQQQQPGLSLFPNSGGSLLGGLAPTWQQPQQQMTPPITADTKLKDLPEGLKKVFESFYLYVREQSDDAEQEWPHDSGKQITETADILQKKLSKLRGSLDSAVVAVQSLKAEVSRELKNGETARNAELARRRELSDFGGSSQAPPTEYFLHLLSQFQRRLQQYSAKIEEIDQLLKPMSNTQPLHTAKMIQDTIRTQHEFFSVMSAQVAVIHDKVDEMKTKYLTVFPERGNPFEKEKKHSRKHKVLGPAPAPPIPQAQPQQQQQQQQLSLFPSTGSALGGSSLFPSLTTQQPSTSLFGPTPSLTTGTTASSTLPALNLMPAQGLLNTPTVGFNLTNAPSDLVGQESKSVINEKKNLLAILKEKLSPQADVQNGGPLLQICMKWHTMGVKEDVVNTFKTKLKGDQRKADQYRAELDQLLPMVSNAQQLTQEHLMRWTNYWRSVQAPQWRLT